MKNHEIQEVLHAQKQYFETGATLPVSRRKEALHKLLTAVETNEEAIAKALWIDLGKSSMESYMCEIALVKSEINYMLHHIGRFAKERRVHTPLAQFMSRSFVKPSPYGCVLIMSPWNYPLLLSIDPLADALAAGNTAVIKPSAYAPATSNLLAKIIEETFEARYVTVIQGGREENNSLLDCDFDYIFFTGSKEVGREVMAKAARRLIPVTLELGGKSPCIVDESADLKLAAKRIVFGKFINCGQTCVAPDYIYCDKKISEALIKELSLQIRQQYGHEPLNNPDYGKIINKKHFERITGLVEANKDKTVSDFLADPDTLQIAPTVMTGVSWEDAVMQEEIFGPVLPVLCFDNLSEAAAKINSMDSPLALYLFSSDKKNIRFITERVQFGGGCINDTLIHLATSSMGFGGVGESGMGAYHGKRGFDAFTHEKSMVDKKTFIDLPMRYHPYTKLHKKLVRMFVR